MPENSEYFTKENWNNSPLSTYCRSIYPNTSSCSVESVFQQKNIFTHVFKLWLNDELTRWQNDCEAEVKNQISEAVSNEIFILVASDEIIDIPSDNIINWLNSYVDIIVGQSYRDAKKKAESLNINPQSAETGYLKTSGFQSMAELEQGLVPLNDMLTKRKQATLANILQQENTKIMKSGTEIGWFETASAMFVNSVQQGSWEGSVLIGVPGAVDGAMEIPLKKNLLYPDGGGTRKAKRNTSLGNKIFGWTGKKSRIANWAKTSATSFEGSSNAWNRTDYRIRRGGSVGIILYFLQGLATALIQTGDKEQKSLFWGSEARAINELLKEQEKEQEKNK